MSQQFDPEGAALAEQPLNNSELNNSELTQKASLAGVLAVASAALAACGGGGGSSAAAPNNPSPSTPSTPDVPNVPETPLTQAQAARLLSQASFGPSMAEIDQLTGNTTSSWLNSQFNTSTNSHKAYVDSVVAALPAGGKAEHNHVFETFWKQSVEGKDQLRQRIKFALSQIFVISLVDSGVGNKPRGVAAYYDMLGEHAFGNFRALLEAVTLHPMMGVYLAMLKNQKEAGNRVPDQNYAREVMQLFTIGLYQLNLDGSNQLKDGKPIETYSAADIVGLSRAFTGWSWAGPDKSDARFRGGNLDRDADWKPMQAYPQFHSTLEKSFLGVTISAQSAPQMEADLKIALDTLFQHPNVGPFFAKQMIQRLITSNPSKAFVSRVASAFNNNGAGVRGDMKAVIKAIFTDPEARMEPNLLDPGIGKLREPILRLANWMRAFNCSSASGRFLMRVSDDALTGLAQTPFRSPSVFNYYRPGYVPPNTSIANANLVAPEMQITAETTVVGYLNVMRDVIVNGAGASGFSGNTGRDIKPNYAAEMALTDSPEKLVDRVALLLMGKIISSTLRNQIIAAINSVVISATNSANADLARRNRVSLTVFLCMASPEYLVQK